MNPRREMDIISVKTPSNCVDPGFIYDEPALTTTFQTAYRKILDKFIPNDSRVPLELQEEVKLIPLYFNYFDTLNNSTNTNLEQHLRDKATTDGIWFFNVFIIIDGQSVVRGSRAAMELTTTGGIELPPDLIELISTDGIELPPSISEGDYVPISRTEIDSIRHILISGLDTEMQQQHIDINSNQADSQ